MAFHAIKAGEGDTYVAGGVESVSQTAGKLTTPEDKNPRFTDTSRSDYLADAYIAMGLTAENVARQYSISRQRQDEFAVLSQNRAEKAIANGFFEREITPFTTGDGTVVARDDSPRAGTTLEGIASLKPAFLDDGTVTAGNSCPLNDGAAATVVMSADKAKALGLTPLARIVASAVSGVAPEIMGVGPIEAVKKVLAQAGMAIGDIDVVELNEAFAAQSVAVIRDAGLDPERTNPNGGAIALGHPVGATGAILTLKLLHELRRREAELGMVTMCIGGGQALAAVFQACED
jgi:acetyl-CoA C-acetyltransferase